AAQRRRPAPAARDLARRARGAAPGAGPGTAPQEAPGRVLRQRTPARLRPAPGPLHHQRSQGDDMTSKLLAAHSLKWNPFPPAVPVEALLVTPQLESFTWRVEQLARRAGLAPVCRE